MVVFFRLIGATTGGVLIAAALVYLMHLMIVPETFGAAAPNRADAFRIAIASQEPVPAQHGANPGLTELLSALRAATGIARPVPPPNPEQVPTDTGMENMQLKVGISDSELEPLIRIQPSYPVQALQRNLEGYVLLRYTVTDSGTVRDVVVVESTDPVFTLAARQAVAQFRYQPRTVDGRPVTVPDVRIRVSFRIAD